MAFSAVSSPTIVLLNLPQKTFVGIDLIAFNSSPNFHGVNNLPTGFHCLYTGTDAALSIRHCHWLKFDQRVPNAQIYVLKWRHETESLELLDSSGESALAATRSVPSLRGRGLVDYVALQDAQLEVRSKQTDNNTTTAESANEGTWLDLSRHITTSSLNRILGTPETTTQSWTISSVSSAAMDAESIPGLSTEEAAEVLHDNNASTIGLIPISLKQTWPQGAIGRERTEKARDRSWYLSHLIENMTSGDTGNEKTSQAGAKELLAELQFCFIMVLTLANYSCLEQWKRILSVVFTCKAALSKVEGFFAEVVRVLRGQLERVEDVDGGLFEMGDEAGSAWLRGLLKTFRGHVDEIFIGPDNGSELRGELVKLDQFLKDTYGWEDESSLLRRGMVDLEDGERVEVQMEGVDKEDETGEYAPVVVEM